uniref:F-box domain-containing protein n=1 Tax=Tetranychus urticae TaxID=32264 RepID=A0A158P5L1_TETUR
MLINELPDDCLLTIFDYIQDLRDLINCFKVQYSQPLKSCINEPIIRRWQMRLYFNLRIIQQISVTVSKNWRIKIVERTKKLQYLIGAPIEDMVRLIINSNSLKGIIFDCDNHLEFGLVPENANLEMLSTGYIYPKMSGIYENVKQLHLWNYNLGLFESVAHCFPNLERLQIYATEGNFKHFIIFYNCLLTNLFHSAYIKIDSRTITFNHLITRDNLRDLVIQFVSRILLYFNSEKRAIMILFIISLSTFIRFSRLICRLCMLKYPNLKHLALRGTSLKDEHIMQLILILPKLTILDIRKSYGVSQEADNYVRDYCEQYGRSIKFYFKPFDERIKSDRPQLLNRPEKICRGFDFMEHCFFKSFYELPHFLDPIDD